MSETQEHIKNRMLQTAAKIWGYAETEDTSNFDPLLNLLLSVNASELERLSNEIHHSRSRVMDRIMQLLAPDVLTGPNQASAILNANSIEHTAVLSPKEMFFVTQNVHTEKEQHNLDVCFTAADSFYINACSVKCLATNNKMFRYTADSITKELIAVNNEQVFLPNATLYLAIDNPQINLSNTQFYFQYRSEINKEVFYKQLKNVTWHINDKVALTRQGYNIVPNTNADWFAQQVLNQQSSISDKFLKLVKQQYESFFITLQEVSKPDLSDTTAIPSELNEVFGASISNLENENLRWVKIVFPENITNAMLENVSVFANAIPIVNRRVHEISYRLQEMMNVIPLSTGENQFFDIDEIEDENGKKFHIRENENIETEELNVVMRNGGAGRFDERDANIVIENLVQLLRDESAAFANLGKDLIAQEVKSLQQSITKIEQLIGGTKNSKSSFSPYLMVRNNKKQNSRFLYITYWSTNGALANGIRAGTRLNPYKANSIKASSAFLLTHTHGGKNRLSQTDSVVAYKYALLSKDRIMSREDIRLYCKLTLGSMVQDVTISKGFMVSADNTSGFMKTLEVTITVSKKDFDETKETGELENVEKNIALQLSEKSLVLTPFKVFLKPDVSNNVLV